MEQIDKQITIRAINDIHGCETVDDVVLALTNYVSAYGFESVSITQLVSPARAGKKRIAISNWPEEFLKERIQKGTIVRDPIAQEALRSKTPFTWRDVRSRADKQGRKIIDQAMEVTSKDGLLVPIHPYDSIPGCVSLGTSKVDLSNQEISWIDVICVQAYMKIVEFLGPFPFDINVNLTGREIDVIHYAAAGKTNWEISRILNISEHTVRAYLQSAAVKLKTVSKTHTVALAIANRLVLT